VAPYNRYAEGHSAKTVISNFRGVSIRYNLKTSGNSAFEAHLKSLMAEEWDDRNVGRSGLGDGFQIPAGSRIRHQAAGNHHRTALEKTDSGENPSGPSVLDPLNTLMRLLKSMNGD